MRESPPKVITIPAKPEVASRQAVQRQLRVAAYCRVSTDDEEQLTSYEAQQNYYTDKIMTNREWTMAGIFADEGITGTSARKRPEFLKMIRLCKQKKIDIVLTKSMNEAAALKEKRALIEEQRQSNAQAVRRIEDAAAAMAQASTHISEWDEALIRQLVDTVKVNSAEKITVFLRGGVQVEQDMI